jgi:hypothetical protein
MCVKKMNEIKKIIGIESAVLETFEPPQIGRLVMPHKIVRRHIHALHQFATFLNNGGAIAPGKNGSKKSGYFNVLFFSEQVGNTNRIGSNERRLIVRINLFVQKSNEVVGGRHPTKIRGAAMLS